MENESNIIFIGPTSIALENQPENFEIKGPIKRGDCLELINSHFKGNVVIVDGYFGQDLAVTHREIMLLINSGVSVTGISSIGAIRAAELESEGMHGFGEIFNRFKEDPDFRDDEVALTHAPEPYYFPISEPLYHIRLMLTHFLDIGKIDKKSYSTVISKLENMWFGYRTLIMVNELLKSSIQNTCEKFELEIEIQKFRQKGHDVNEFLKI